MSISKVEPSELVEIMYLMRICSIENNSMGCMYWNYFSNQIPELISSEKVYKYRKTECTIGIIALNNNNGDVYKDINWSYTKGKILSVRILVHPKWREKGICKELLEYAEQFGKQNGYNNIRIDTNFSNDFAIAVLTEAQYKKAGEIHLPFNVTSVICFEKEII